MWKFQFPAGPESATHATNPIREWKQKISGARHSRFSALGPRRHLDRSGYSDYKSVSGIHMQRVLPSPPRSWTRNYGPAFQIIDPAIPTPQPSRNQTYRSSDGSCRVEPALAATCPRLLERGGHRRYGVIFLATVTSWFKWVTDLIILRHAQRRIILGHAQRGEAAFSRITRRCRR